MKHGDKITIYGRESRKRLQLVREYYQGGIRYYDMQDMDNPAAPARPYYAEYIDRFFDHQKGSVSGKKINTNIKTRRRGIHNSY